LGACGVDVPPPKRGWAIIRPTEVE
jgi:hypothetical protein